MALPLAIILLVAGAGYGSATPVSSSWYVDIGIGDEDYASGFVDPPDTHHVDEPGWQCRLSDSESDYDFRNLAYQQEGVVDIGSLPWHHEAQISLCVANGAAPDDLDIYSKCGDDYHLLYKVRRQGHVGGPIQETFDLKLETSCGPLTQLVFINPTDDGLPQSGVWGFRVTVLA